MEIIKIAMHHAGGLADDRYAKSQHLSWQHINNAHQARWDFKSSLGYYGGYNFYCDKGGSIKQFRAIGEETAAQKGHNFDTISICIAGNFVKKDGVPVEAPNEKQKVAVCLLLNKLVNKDYTGLAVIPGTVIILTSSSIHHHTFYQPTTECDCLPAAFWREEMKKQVKAPTEPVFVPPALISTPSKVKVGPLEWLQSLFWFLFRKRYLGGGDREHCGDL